MDTGEKKTRISLSVIIPVYNTARWVGECLESILAQEAFDLEVICVDDGSTDNSLEILREYEKKDSRIIIITQENQGVSVARNAGIDAAHGRYIWFVDSDDTINPEMIRPVYRAVTDYNFPQVICFSSYAKYGDEDYRGPRNASKYLKKPISRLMGLHTGPDTLRILREEKGDWYYVWANLFRKDFLTYFQLRYLKNLYRNQDQEFMLRVYRDADSVLCIPEGVINHRIREGSNMDLLKSKATPRDVKNKFDLVAEIYSTYSGSETLQQKVPTFKKGMMTLIYNCQKVYLAVKDENRINEVDSLFEAEKPERKVLFDLMIRYPVETGRNLIALAETEKKLKSGRQRIYKKLTAPIKKMIKKMRK